MSRLGVAAFAVAILAAAPALAEEPKPEPEPSAAPAGDSKPGEPPVHGRGVWRSFRAGADLVGSIPMAGTLDASWSFTTLIDTTLIDGTLKGPEVAGTIGHYTRRVLYGTSWTVMLGLEGLATLLASGGKLDWVSAASYRTDWVVPVDNPTCAHTGSSGGCGLGVGNFAFISLRPKRSHWWFEAGGGSFEQRILFDALRTVGESSWVLTPISALREFMTDPEAPVALHWLVGPGIYGGMHNANMHPSIRGAEVYRNRPWSELYPLDGGVGPGVRTELNVVFLRHLTLDGDLTVAPFVIGDATEHPSHNVAPLDYSRDGMPIWRRLVVGIGWQDYRVVPFKPTLAFFGAELSERSLDRLGYRGVMLRFDIPLRVPAD